MTATTPSRKVAAETKENLRGVGEREQRGQEGNDSRDWEVDVERSPSRRPRSNWC
jgi:hypothetical protein